MFLSEKAAQSKCMGIVNFLHVPSKKLFECRMHNDEVGKSFPRKGKIKVAKEQEITEHTQLFTKYFHNCSNFITSI